jgi:glycosyltransferase involved in cell wall biosynthesis
VDVSILILHVTGCITIMKAMSCGAIPITSRFSYSVLPELTVGFDMGPSVSLNLSTASNDSLFEDWVHTEYVRAVGAAVRWALENPGEMEKMREKMKEYARNTFTWRRTARIFLDELSR